MGIKRDVDSGKRDSLGRTIKVSGASLSNEGNIKTRMSLLQGAHGERTDDERDMHYDEILETLDDIPFDYSITRDGSGGMLSPSDVAHSYGYDGDFDDLKVTIPMGYDKIWAEANYNTVVEGHKNEMDMDFDGHSLTMPVDTFLELARDEDKLIGCFEGIYNGEAQSETEIENVTRKMVEDALPKDDTEYYSDLFADEIADDLRNECNFYFDDRVLEILETQYGYDHDEYDDPSEHPNYDEAAIAAESDIDDEVYEHYSRAKKIAQETVDGLREHMMNNIGEYQDAFGDVSVDDGLIMDYITDSYY